MKKNIIPVLVLVIIFAGCKKDTIQLPAAEDFRIPDIRGIEQYLSETERIYSDIRPGLEKQIYWPGEKIKTPYAIVYLHGYGASKGELSPAVEQISKASGFNVFYTRLKGHSRQKEAFKGVSPEDWFSDAAEALYIGSIIGEKVIIIGSSTGATLSVPLLTEYKDIIAACVWISPNFKVRQPLTSILPTRPGKHLMRIVLGEYRNWEPKNELQKKYWSYVQHIDAVAAMLKTVNMVNKMDFSMIETPLLVLYNSNDSVVDQERTIKLFEKTVSEKKKLKEISTEDPSFHILAGDAFSPGTTDRFVSEVLGFFIGAL